MSHLIITFLSLSLFTFDSFNQLCLPDYESYEQFEKSLIIAISEGSEGFGMS